MAPDSVGQGEPALAGRHTEHPTGEGKLYHCAVKNACSKRSARYSVDERMTAQLAVNAYATGWL